MELPLTSTYFFEPKKLEILPTRNYLPSCLLISFAAHIALFAFFLSPAKKFLLDVPKIAPSSSVTFHISHPTVTIAKTSSPVIKQEYSKPVLPKAITKPVPIPRPAIKETKEIIIPEPQSGASEATSRSTKKGTSEISSGGIGQVASEAKTNYESVLANWLERYRSYPSRALRRGITGEGLLYVKINQDGKVLEFKLEKSTNEPMLDEAIFAMLKKADPLPEIPAMFNLTQYEFAVPVDFKID